MDVILGQLEALPPSKWGLHETVLCQELGLKAKENLSARKQLGQLLSALKKGYWGQKRNKSWTSTGYETIDLGITSIP
jgi:hypothetical protein